MSNTDVSLKEYIDERFNAVETRFESLDRAILKAEAAMDRRLEGMNEFRAQLNDQIHTYLPRPEYNVRHDTLVARIDELNSRVEKAAAESAGSRRMMGTIGALALAFITILTAVLHYLK